MSTLRVDWTRCDGRGLCAELLPELLELDPWGYPLARAQGQPGEGQREVSVPPALRPHAERAVLQCPRLALRLQS